MGQSTDACIAFGFALEAEDEDELMDLLQLSPEQQQQIEDGELDLHEWFSSTWPGLVLETHCSHEYPMYIVALENTTRSASRGSPEDLYLDELGDLVTSAGRHKLAACAKAYNLSPPDFTWLLYSYWH